MIATMQHNIEIIPIPAFEDNYIWLIHNGKDAIVVDPGDANPVIETLTRLGLTLNSILITHHHHDHIGGVTALLIQFPDCVIYAPALEPVSYTHLDVYKRQHGLCSANSFDTKAWSPISPCTKTCCGFC